MTSNDYNTHMISELTSQIKNLNGAVSSLMEINERLKKDAYEKDCDIKDLKLALPFDISKCNECHRYRFSKDMCEHCGALK